MMNERLRDLYEEAHELKPVIVMDPVTCQPTHKIGRGGRPMYHRVFNPEKFAGLIIGRCIQVGGPEDSYRDEWFAAKADSVNKIKQRFGVK